MKKINKYANMYFSEIFQQLEISGIGNEKKIKNDQYMYFRVFPVAGTNNKYFFKKNYCKKMQCIVTVKRWS